MEPQDPTAGSSAAAPFAPPSATLHPPLDPAPTAVHQQTHAPAVMAEVDPRVWTMDDAPACEPLAIPTRFLRWLALTGGAVALGLSGWQSARVLDDQSWSSQIAFGALAASILAASSLLLWTWVIVENARRLLVIARSQHPPDPIMTALAWMAPLAVAGAAGAAVVYLQASAEREGLGDTSPLPLAVGLVSMIVTLLVMYRPLFLLSDVTRRLGGVSVTLARWFWVPVSLAVVGSLSLIALDAGGAYDDFDGVVPPWALGVVALPPLVIVLWLAWRGGRAMEDAVGFAYLRRNGDITAGIGRGRLGLMARALRADARPPIQRDVRQRIRLVPGDEILRLALVIAIAALVLLSTVAAIVMFLFWRESSDGLLLQSQQDRAWDALAALRRVERLFALGLLGVTSVWAFVTVLNARVASGRRRNPVLAAVAWPAAAAGIWAIGSRVGDSDDTMVVVAGFALQAAVAYVPFFFVERAAVSVGARRQPVRLAYALGVILLVHVQGLAGLSTLDVSSPADRFGRLAGYLALAALIELLSMLAVTEASRLVTRGARQEADRHNVLADRCLELDRRQAAVAMAQAQSGNHTSAGIS
ncbi:MAG: hypothetical protein ACE37B_07515 [Ilumatobacter sp.]|jgi:hypothetical protein|uniref:hypothetical protein n=1 Tax=Ilumatobacter sp. TaxID=1967498 RepID=UPI00391C7FCE